MKIRRTLKSFWECLDPARKSKSRYSNNIYLDKADTSQEGNLGVMALNFL